MDQFKFITPLILFYTRVCQVNSVKNARLCAVIVPPGEHRWQKSCDAVKPKKTQKNQQ